MKHLIAICLIVLLALGVLLAGGKKKYMVISPHTVEKCLAAIDDVAEDETLLENTEWGCMGGDHTSYSTVMADDEKAAKKMVPEELREDAKVVLVTKLTKKKIQEIHEKMHKKK